jgi:hypothetical protein
MLEHQLANLVLLSRFHTTYGNKIFRHKKLQTLLKIFPYLRYPSGGDILNLKNQKVHIS